MKNKSQILLALALSMLTSLHAQNYMDSLIPRPERSSLKIVKR